MVRRGRPLMRAAMVGGVAYHAGKNVHQNTAAAPTLVAPAGSLSEAAIAQLKELGQLKEAGVLTHEEFDAQKAQLLAS
jgi:putative oligomerization/nucleic acid binding protein